LIFDGVDDYVNCGSGASLKPTQNITIEMWIKPNSTQNQWADILGGHQNNQGYVVQQDSTDPNNYYFAYNKDGTGAGWQGTGIKTQLTSDVWQHFVVQKEGSIIRHFLNGTLSASGTVSGDIWYSPIEPFYIGIGWLLTSSRYFEGSIDEVRIWNTALTAEQLIHYGFIGLLAPYKEPPKAFKIGSSIPLKWQYTDYSGDVVDSPLADPDIGIEFVENGDTPTDLTDIDAPGSSGLRYDSLTMTWHFNWQTKGWEDGIYKIRITSGQTLQVNGPFLIQLR